MALVAERNHTHKKGVVASFFKYFFGGFGAIFGVLWAVFLFWWLLLGNTSAFLWFLGPGLGLLSAAGTKIVGRGFFCSSLWPLLGQVTCMGQPPHRRGRVSPDKRVPPLPWWRSHPTSTSQPGWGGWVVGSGGKRNTP